MSFLLSTFALWAWTALLIGWILPDSSSSFLLIAEVIVSITALIMWREGGGRFTEVEWLGQALVGLLLLLIFVQASCAGTLQFHAGRPFCESYKSGWSMALDIGSLIIVLVGPACALRRSLMRIFP